MIEIVKKAKDASFELMKLPEDSRVKTLLALSKELKENTAFLISENKKDIDKAQLENYPSSYIDRLKLDEKRIQSMAKTCEEIASYPQVVGIIESEQKKDNGIMIQKERIPIGLLLMIFESRPNVIIDASALAIKSGNAILLKGGKEAFYSNNALKTIIEKSIKDLLPPSSITVLDSQDRSLIDELLTLNHLIDLVIPRGGEKLIDHVYKHSKIPVIAHYKGLCHIYIDKEVDSNIVLPILLNAKVQRPGVCNAVETILWHKDLSFNIIGNALEELQQKGVEIYADKNTKEAFPNLTLKEATHESYMTEHLSLKASVKQVSSIEEAIIHIKEYGSRHTEAILSSDQNAIETFKKSVDASLIAVNISTRFNDGSELLLGGELGISTSKLHAYGAMGAKEMTTTRYVLLGSGQIRK